MRMFNIGLLLLCLTAAAVQADSRVLDAARDYIIDRFDLDPASVTVSMRDNKSFDCLIPGDSIGVYATSDAPPRGNYSLRYEIIRGGAIIKTISASVRVSIWADVCTANRKIKRGESIALDDLTVERREVTRNFDKVITSANDLLDMRAAKSIQAGGVIERDMMEVTPVISRGDEVIIRCDVGAMEISTTGVAKNDGSPGDQITVQNKATKQRVIAEVFAPGVVVIRR